MRRAGPMVRPFDAPLFFLQLRMQSLPLLFLVLPRNSIVFVGFSFTIKHCPLSIHPFLLQNSKTSRSQPIKASSFCFGSIGACCSKTSFSMLVQLLSIRRPYPLYHFLISRFRIELRLLGLSFVSLIRSLCRGCLFEIADFIVALSFEVENVIQAEREEKVP